MALNAAVEWEIRTTGTATNGGGFKAGASGTDWSQQDAAQYAVTDGVTAGTTTITSATANFGTDVVGNIIYVQGGSGGIVADWYEIISRTNSTTIVVDRSTGLTAGVGVTLNIGGGLSTLTAVATEVVAGNTVHVKDGTYNETLTAAVAGGNGTPIRWLGYAATHNDAPLGATRPLIDGQSTRANCISVTATGNSFSYFRLTGATGNNFTASATFVTLFCKSSLAGAFGIGTSSNITGIIIGCEANNNTTRGIALTGTSSTSYVEYNYSHDNTTDGFILAGGGGGVVIGNISDSNAGHGFSIGAVGAFLGNTAYNNTGASSDGFTSGTNGNTFTRAFNNISASNGRYGFSRASALVPYMIFNWNCYNGNGTAGLNNITAGVNDATVDPIFVDAPNGDFAPGSNNIIGAGWPGVFPGALSTGYMTIGAVQKAPRSRVFLGSSGKVSMKSIIAVAVGIIVVGFLFLFSSSREPEPIPIPTPTPTEIVREQSPPRVQEFDRRVIIVQ